MRPLPPARLRAATLIVPALVFAAGSAAAQDQHLPLHKSLYGVVNVHRHCDAASEEAVKAEIAVMDRVGIRTSVVLLMDDGWSDKQVPEWIRIRNKYPDRIAVFSYIDFRRLKEPTFFEDLVKELERQAALGVQGVKVWKDLGMYKKDADGKLLAIDDPRLDPFWRRCGELGLPILIHAADPREYWYPRTYNTQHYGMTDRPKHYDDPNMPKWEELMRQRDHVLAKHPKTTFIGAHMGSMTYDLAGLGERFDKYPNFHVDSAARLRILGRLNPQAVRDFFTKYQDRILWGSDSTFPHQWKDADELKARSERSARFFSRHFEYFETDRFDVVEPYGHASAWLRLAGAKLPPAVLEKFYHGNAERLIPGLKKK